MDLEGDILSLSLDKEHSVEKDGEGPPIIKFNETAEVERNSSALESTHHVEGLETAKGKAIVIDVDTSSPAQEKESEGGEAGEQVAPVEGDTKAEGDKEMNE